MSADAHRVNVTLDSVHAAKLRALAQRMHVNEKNAGLPDLGPREWVVIVPIVALAVLMGVLPNLFLRPMEGSVERLVSRVRSSAPVEIRAN